MLNGFTSNAETNLGVKNAYVWEMLMKVSLDMNLYHVCWLYIECHKGQCNMKRAFLHKNSDIGIPLQFAVTSFFSIEEIEELIYYYDFPRASEIGLLKLKIVASALFAKPLFR